jgi:hypothetical protein
MSDQQVNLIVEAIHGVTLEICIIGIGIALAISFKGK